MSAEYWTDDKVAELIRLWNDDHSSQQIAERWGISRSAVIGKVFRLRKHGVNLRAEIGVTRMLQAKRAKQKRAARRPERQPKLRPQAPQERLLARLAQEARSSSVIGPASDDAPPRITDIMALEDRHCRYPIDIPDGDGGVGYCGHERVAGLPYCRRHALRCYQVPPVEARALADRLQIRVAEALTARPKERAA